MKIDLVIIKPPAFEHGEVFAELKAFYLYALKKAGHEVTCIINKLNPHNLNIIIDYYFLPFFPELKNINYIIVQTEQLSFAAGWFSSRHAQWETALKQLQGARQIWDYSIENLNFLKNFNLEAKLILPGFVPDLQTIKPADIQDIDVLFYGSSSERRFNIIKGLESQCNAIGIYGIYGKERDALIARSKIILNIHTFPNLQILEQVRIFYLLINKSFVLSEGGAWNPYGDSLITVEYDQLIDQVIYWLKNDRERALMADKGFNCLKEINSDEKIAEALRQLA